MAKTLKNNFQISEIKIGKQIWSLQNLDVPFFRNGDPISIAKSIKEWKKLNLSKTPACCYYEFNEKKFKSGGLLYNFYAISDLRNIAPLGFKIPTDKDWSNLIEYCGKKKLAGNILKSKNGWETFSKDDPNGIDKYGFNAMPVGYIKNIVGGELEFMNINFMTIFWTLTNKKGTLNEVYYWQLTGKSVERDTTVIENDLMGLSVRLIKE